MQGERVVEDIAPVIRERERLIRSKCNVRERRHGKGQERQQRRRPMITKVIVHCITVSGHGLL